MKAIKNSQILGKTLNYHSDGTGRDAYVGNDNGGFIMQHYHKSPPEKKHGSFLYGKPRPQTAIADSRIKHYITDGTGRDSYIKCTDGGQSSYYTCNQKNVNAFFNNNLRTYQRMPIYNKYDFLTVSQTLRSKQEFYKTQKLVKPQKQLIERLSQPKQQIFYCARDKTKKFNLNLMGRSIQLLDKKNKSTQQQYWSKRAL